MSLGISSICRASTRPAGNAGLIAIPQNAVRHRSQLRPRALSSFATLHDAPNTTPNPLATLTKESKDNRGRNKMFREAFSQASQQDIERKLSSPFVTPRRQYPSPVATEQSAREAWESAKVQAGLETIWGFHKPKEHYVASELKWVDTFERLRKMTSPTMMTSSQMSAMRIVLPGSWDLEVSNRTIDFIDSTTGLQQRLRIYNDHQNPSAIVVRGTRRTLAKAADELVQGRRGIKIFQLGDVDACDYEAKQLWPKIQTPSKPSSAEKTPQLWVHRERNDTHWIDTKYEDIPRPSSWSVEAFDEYISSLVYGRLRPHLVVPLYAEQTNGEGKSDNKIDSDGIRIGLITKAFMDPGARPHITTPTLKMALAFMAHRGGHRASADNLFTHAEEWGLPMDAETFNIMLEGYVSKRDHRYFDLFLRKMQSRYIPANARTWLLFLRLVQKDYEKMQVVVAMFELGLFRDPGLSRAIAGTMASFDAYKAFRSGLSLMGFMDRQRGRYGEQWLSDDALNAVLQEYFRWHGESRPNPADYNVLVEELQHYGHRTSTRTVNLILEHCLVNQDWSGAVWALHLMWKDGCEADYVTFEHIIKLAINTSSPHALAAAFFYGALDHRMRTQIRYALKKVFFQRHSNNYWDHNQVPIFTAEMAAAMQRPTPPQSNKAVQKAIRVINTAAEGLIPTEPLAFAMASAVLTDREMKRGRKTKPLEIGMKEKSRSDEAAVPVDEIPKPAKTFRLDTCFDAMSMVAGWKTRPRKEKLRPGPSQETALEASPSSKRPSVLESENSAARDAKDTSSNEATADDTFLQKIRSERRKM